MSEARRMAIQPREKNVTVIPQRIRPIAQALLYNGIRRKAAAYARVSTGRMLIRIKMQVIRIFM